MSIVAPLAVYVFVMSITPGPNNLMLLTSGVNFGFARTIPHMLGISAGFAVQALLIGCGLGVVFTNFPWLQTGLRWVGLAYLLYLAWKSLHAGDIKSLEAAKPISFLEAAIFQWVNPKAWVMAITAATLFLPPDQQILLGAMIVAVVGAMVNLPCVSCWAAFGTLLRRALTDEKRRRLFNGVMAVLLVGTGLIMLET